MMRLLLSLGVLVVIIGAGAAYYFRTPADTTLITTPNSQAQAPATDRTPAAKTELFGGTDNAPAAAPGSTYTGTRLAGDLAPLLGFNQADFAAVQQSNKLIVLFFYANWCPICRAEFPVMQDIFNELTTDQVIGFRVNYNDDETDDLEVALAREHGIAYQHTKVLLKTLRHPIQNSYKHHPHRLIKH